MARPRTLGPTISFRLPLDAHDVMVERAEAHGQSVADYARDKLTEAARRHRTAVPTTPATSDRQVTPRWKNPKKP